jgi:hypothetical protein
MVSPAIWPVVEQPASRAIAATTVLIAAVLARLALPNRSFLIFLPLLDVCPGRPIKPGRPLIGLVQLIRRYFQT